MSDDSKLYILEKFIFPLTIIFFIISVKCTFNICYDLYYHYKINISHITIFFINKRLEDIVEDLIAKYDLLTMENIDD